MTRSFIAICVLALLWPLAVHAQCPPAGCSVGTFGRATIYPDGSATLRGGLGGATLGTPDWRPARPRKIAEPSQQPLEPAVVQTICRSGGTTRRGTGTIIAVLKTTPRVGAVLTCCHTLQAGGELTIRYQNKIYPAQVVDQDGTLDLALLTFEAPAECYYFPLATEDPSQGTVVIWEGFSPGGPFRRQGPVAGYSGSMIRVTGTVRDGMSGGPIFRRGGGLISVITGGIGQRGSVTHTEGPAISWIRSFLRRGRYAWTLQGCVTPETIPTPPAELPPVPVPETETPPDTSCCDELRILIAQNAEAIAGLLVAVAIPSPQGERGERGEKGDRGLPGPAFVVGDLTDDDIHALVLRLPPIRLVTFKASPTSAETAEILARIRDAKPGDMIQEITGYLGGSPLRLRLVTVKKSGDK